MKKSRSIETIFWKDIKKEISIINPDFSKLINKINPPDTFEIYRARYPFGAKIAEKGTLYLPVNDNEVVPISSDKVPRKIKNNLQRRELPLGIMLKKRAEIFHDTSRGIISRFLMSPGSFFGLWHHLDDSNATYVKWMWTLISGARTLYMIPKIANAKAHKNIKDKFGISSYAPSSSKEHWQVFSEIANSEAFEPDWYSEMLFFSDKWFEAISSDPEWLNVKLYFIETAWKESEYWRNKSTFELIWEDFISHFEKLRPKLYISCLVKQILLSAAGIMPCLSLAINDDAAPISKLEQVYREIFGFREYFPVFMQAHSFSLTDGISAYYSIQEPNLLDSLPMPKFLPSALEALSEIKDGIELFENIFIEHDIVKNSPFDLLSKGVHLDYFHSQVSILESRKGIKSTKVLCGQDAQFKRIQAQNPGKNYPTASPIISGLVKISTEK